MPWSNIEIPVKLYNKPVWPAWALNISSYKLSNEIGVGDTIQRLYGNPITETFKRFHEDTFGLWARPCGCNNKIQRWNQLYKYETETT